MEEMFYVKECHGIHFQFVRTMFLGKILLVKLISEISFSSIYIIY